MLSSPTEGRSNDIVLRLPKVFYQFLEPAPFKISWGGRGGAKSYSIAKLLVYIGFDQKKRILCAREYQNTLKESAKALIEEQITELGLSWFYTITEAGIFGLNGTEFMFKGLRLNVGSLNSMVGIDICWLEEGQFNTKASIDALLPTIRKKGSEIWVSMNPNKKTDVLYEMFLTGSPPAGSIIINVNYYDNPWFHETTLPAQMERMRLREPGKFRHVWLGELETRSDALVFSNWRTGEIDIPLGMRAFYGADWGYAIHPTVLTRAFVFTDTNELYIANEAYKFKCEITDLTALFLEVPGSRFGNITADSARPELIAHMRKENWRIHPSIKGKNSVLEGVEFMKAFDIVVSPNCPKTIGEFETYTYDVDKDGVILDNIVDENNHCIDSIRYGIEARRRGELTVRVRDIN